MEERKKITQEAWIEFVKKNSNDSYSFVTCYAILVLWEAGVTNEPEAIDVLRNLKMGLSGAQAEMAIAYALGNDAEEWLDKDMVKIRRPGRG